MLDLLELVGLGALGYVSVVVTNHLVEESLGLVGGGNLHALLVNDLDDVSALFVELLFDHGLVNGESIVVLGVFWVLLDG